MSAGLSDPYGDWTQAPERGSPGLLALIVGIARRVPRVVARALLYPIVLYFVLFSPRQARASRQFLARVLPREPRWSDVFRHYLTFAGMLLDRVYWLSPTAPDIAVRVHGAEAVADLLNGSDRGLIVVGSHLGSFEALRGAGAAVTGRRVRPLMYVANARKVQRVLDAINPALVGEVISAGRADTMLQIHAALAAGDIVGILADRSPFEERSVTAPFMGTPASLPVGAYRLAALADVPVVFGCAVLDGSGYSMFFHDMGRPAGRSRAERAAWIDGAAQRFAALLEQHARAWPYNWFNFYDFWQGGGARGEATAPAHAPRAQ